MVAACCFQGVALALIVCNLAARRYRWVLRPAAAAAAVLAGLLFIGAAANLLLNPVADGERTKDWIIAYAESECYDAQGAELLQPGVETFDEGILVLLLGLIVLLEAVADYCTELLISDVRPSAVSGSLPAQVEDCRALVRAWAAMDVNNNGFCSLSEVNSGVAQHWPELNVKAAIVAAHREAASAGDGQVHMHEFPRFVALLAEFAELHSAFGLADADMDGVIGRGEFLQHGPRLDLGAGSDFDAIDRNGSGTVSFYEVCSHRITRRPPSDSKLAATTESFVREVQAVQGRRAIARAVSDAQRSESRLRNSQEALRASVELRRKEGEVATWST